MKIEDILNEIDWALDSILPIEERLLSKAPEPDIMTVIAQLRGHLMRTRDEIVERYNLKNVKEYKPLKVLPIEMLQMLYSDMPNNLAIKHFKKF